MRLFPWTSLLMALFVSSAFAQSSRQHHAEQPVAPWLAPPEAVRATAGNLPRKTHPKLLAERLGPIFIDGAGDDVSALAGDWRLANEYFSLTFAQVEASPTTGSHPLGGWRDPSLAKPQRIPGALLDIALAGNPVDPLVSFTQGIGTSADGELIQYDEIEPVERGQELGLRLEGSPFINAPLRLETTYWLAAGRQYVQIESRFLNLPEGVRPAALTDVGRWGANSIFVENRGFYTEPQPLAFSGPALDIAAPGLSLRLELSAGVMLGMTQGLQGQTRTLWTGVPANSAPTTTSLRLPTDLPVAQRRALTDMALQRAWLDTQSTATAMPASGVAIRRLYLTSGTLNAAREVAQQVKQTPVGTINGFIREVSGEPAGNAEVYILTKPQSDAAPPIYTIERTNARGEFAVHVPPGRYFVKPVTGFNLDAFGNITSIDVTTRGVVRAEGVRRPAAHARIRVVDDETSAPLAARINVENLAGNGIILGPPGSARLALNQAYVLPAGDTFEMPAGQFVVRATHGIEYESSDADYKFELGGTRDIVIRLRRIVPVGGHLALLPGVRTTATPGVALSAEDVIRMAVGEGLDWLTSGDFETLTDLQPAIDRLDVGPILKASRGFRTAVPAHPEWGQFLLFPIAADAPDPARTRSTWHGATTRKELLAALRKAYPGALIQAEIPWVEGGEGFIGFGEKMFTVAGGEVWPGEDLSVDAINLFPADRGWDIGAANAFLKFNFLRERYYLFSTSGAGDTVLNGQPGYPRLLVNLPETQTTATEKTLFEQFRNKHYQLTTAPFIEFSVAGKRSGEMLRLNDDDPVEWRVVGPSWAGLNIVQIDKEVSAQMKILVNSIPGQTQVVPTDATEQTMKFPLKDLRLRHNKDTLLSSQARGNTIVAQKVRGNRANAPLVPAYAITWPVAIDYNSDERYTAPPWIDGGQ